MGESIGLSHSTAKIDFHDPQPEQRMIRDSVARHFAAGERPRPNAARWDAICAFPRDALTRWRRWALFGVTIPSKIGAAPDSITSRSRDLEENRRRRTVAT